MTTLIKNTVVQLRQLCKKNGIKRYSKLRKAELIEILTKMYTKRIISALVLNNYKKPRNYTEPVPKTLQTCNICLEDTTCVKMCKCTACVCMSCLERVRNPNLCPICRSDTEGYLRSLSNRSTLQNSALSLILSKKIAPIETQTPPPIITHVRHTTRNREEQEALIRQFIRDSDQAFNEWRTTSIREDIYSMHHINGITRTYNFFIASMFSRRSFAAVRRDMVAINDFLETVLDA